jgi:hypothetical protein
MKRIVIIVLLSIILFILVSRRSSGLEAQSEGVKAQDSGQLAKGEVRVTSEEAGKVASGPKVTLFSDCNFTGKSVEVPIGEYASMEKAGFGNDVLSSMKIPAGFKVQIFDHVNFRGPNAIFHKDVDCFTTIKIPGGVKTMNDRVSSLKISKA